MITKEFWKKIYSVALYNEKIEQYFFYCNSLKQYKNNPHIDISDYIWDDNPEYMSLMDYLNACKVYTYLLLNKVDAFGVYPNGQHISIIKYTPEEIDCFQIIF